MRLFSVVAAFVFALFITSSALAANWEVVEVDDDGKIRIITSVDKDSIRRGTDSKAFPKFSRKDGFSAIIKIEFKIKGAKDAEIINNLVSFYEENGVRIYSLLDSYSATKYPQSEKDILKENVDTDGKVWVKVWSFIQGNLK